jgi:hypothetical protein
MLPFSLKESYRLQRGPKIEELGERPFFNGKLIRDFANNLREC